MNILGSGLEVAVTLAGAAPGQYDWPEASQGQGASSVKGGSTGHCWPGGVTAD